MKALNLCDTSGDAELNPQPSQKWKGSVEPAGGGTKAHRGLTSLNKTRATNTETYKHGEILHARRSNGITHQHRFTSAAPTGSAMPQRLSVAVCEERPCTTRTLTQGLLLLLLQTPRSFLWHTGLSWCCCRQCFPCLPSLKPSDSVSRCLVLTYKQKCWRRITAQHRLKGWCLAGSKG